MIKLNLPAQNNLAPAQTQGIPSNIPATARDTMISLARKQFGDDVIVVKAANSIKSAALLLVGIPTDISRIPAITLFQDWNGVIQSTKGMYVVGIMQPQDRYTYLVLRPL
jgi:hypothetical protein